jgi:cell division ATPase FtsA
MMRKELIVTGLDIGSSKTAAVIAGRNAAGEFEIFSHVSVPSKGVSKGTFADIGEATASVTRALSKLREKSGRRPASIYVNISGCTVKGAKSVGMIPISLRGREITSSDMDRAAGVASTIHLGFDREIVGRIVRSFSVDDQPWTLNPLGLYASRLNCEVFVITADINHIQNIYKCVNGAGYDIKELVYAGIAEGISLLDDAGRDEGVMLIDIGDSLTGVSIFSGGSIADLEVIDLGSRDIGGDFRQDARFNDVITRIASRSQEFIRSGGRIQSAVITGGMVFTDGLIEHLEGKLPHPIKVGVAKDIRGDISAIDGLRLSTAIGLARYGYGRAVSELTASRSAPHRLSEKIVDIFNNYF